MPREQVINMETLLPRFFSLSAGAPAALPQPHLTPPCLLMKSLSFPPVRPNITALLPLTDRRPPWGRWTARRITLTLGTGPLPFAVLGLGFPDFF